MLLSCVVAAAFRCDPRRDRTRGEPLPRFHSTAPARLLKSRVVHSVPTARHRHNIRFLSARPTPPCVHCACERLEEFEARLMIRACLKGVELHALCYLAQEAKTNRHQTT